jgi:CheY-like chemotaxis protein
MTYDVVVSDLEMLGVDGRTVLAFARVRSPQAIRICVTGAEVGANDLDAVVIAKPFRPNRPRSTIEAALALREPP